MGKHERETYLKHIKPRYNKATKAEKPGILKEFDRYSNAYRQTD